MSQRRRSVPQGRWRAIALSVMLHSGIVAGAVYGWFTWKSRPPPPVTMAIEGTVVDARALKSPPPPKPEPPAPEPVPEPEPVEEQGPPKPDPAEVEHKKEEDRLAAEKLEQQKLEQEKQQKEQKEKLEADKKEAEKQAATEKAAAEKAAADKKAAEKKKADEAAAAKKAADEKARVAREAELRKAMEAEERGNAVRSSDAAARWYASIVAKIERAWIKPASAQPGVTCIVDVNQVRGGDVTKVIVKNCSINDPALMQSVENAVYSASPLPTPPDPTLFESNLELTFAPTK
jgi:colicin import membrane protein